MPEISNFYGIQITMDHLPPHFHAEYGSHEAMIDMRTGRILRTKTEFPDRATKMIRTWTEEHRLELESNWELYRKNSNPTK